MTETEKKAQDWTDKELEELERKIHAEYTTARDELSAQTTAYFKDYDRRWQKENLALETTRLTEDEVREKWVKLYGSDRGFDGWYRVANHAYGRTWAEAQGNFQRWEYAQLGRGQHWINLRDQMADRMVQSSEVAAGYINEVLPGVYAVNSNAVASIASQSALSQGVTGVKFDLVDEYTVKQLYMSGKLIYPYVPVDISKANLASFSREKVQNALLQGILQGDDMQKMADRLVMVTGMSESSAIRNARTSVNTARNAGKQERYEDLAEQGCSITKIWDAELDDRVRPWHAEANGQEVDYTEKFLVGPEGEEEYLEFPGDPSGSPANVFNCRCAMHTGKIKFHSILSEETRKRANIRLKE